MPHKVRRQTFTAPRIALHGCR